MIIKYLLDNCTWTEYGIQCPNANVARVLHKFLREAILDRHLYLCKVVGFGLKSHHKSRNHMGTYIARHQQVGESYPEVMVNLQDKIFMCDSSCVVRSVVAPGVGTVDNTLFYINRDTAVPVMCTQKNLCTAIGNQVLFDLQLAYDCGYRNNVTNSKMLDSSYFPCNTDFYAGDFFRVLPPQFGSKDIRINYYHGATVDTLRTLLGNWYKACISKSVRKEELVWVQNFTHLIERTTAV